MLRSMLSQARALVGRIAPQQQESVGWWALKIVASRGRPDRIVSATVEAAFDLNGDIIAEERRNRPQPPPDVRLG